MIDNKKYRSEYKGEQIDDAVTKINALDLNSYYDKSEIDKKLGEKLDKSIAELTYYNKEEIDDREHFEDDAPNAQVSVGNLAAGTKLAGLSIKTILKMMVYGEGVYPQLTNPKLNYTINGDGYGMYGSPYNLSGTLIFDRGAINPAYGTSGYRAGLPYRYDIGSNQINDEGTSQNFDYKIEALTPGENDIGIDVYYKEGEQPLNSIGAPYNKPYPAGSIMKTITIVGLTPSFSGFDGKEPIKDDFPSTLIPIDSKDYEQSGLFGDNSEIYGYQIATPGIETTNDVQIILIPEGIEICGIQSWNVLCGGWSWFYGETMEQTISANTWIKTDEIVSKIIDNIAVNYRKYKFNTEDYGLMGDNYFRFFIKEV